MIKGFDKCSKKEATHVMILEKDEGTLRYGELYEYFYDSKPSERTHYVICDDGKLFYDFECVVKVDYYKKSI